MEFKNRYVLGIGFPWHEKASRYDSVGLTVDPIGTSGIKLKFPKELWATEILKYRLVLEKVK